jgi:hypothetical protein
MGSQTYQLHIDAVRALSIDILQAFWPPRREYGYMGAVYCTQYVGDTKLLQEAGRDLLPARLRVGEH